MRSILLLALPALALADNQIPLLDKLRGWFKQVTDSIPTNVPTSFPVPENPVDAGAAKVAAKVVHDLNITNFKSILRPTPAADAGEEPEEWLVYVTGGNKTCYGLCANATSAWEKAVPQLSVHPNGPHLASLDCETSSGGPLCNAWAVSAPSIYHFLLPHPLADQSKPATTVRELRLNHTTVTAQEIIQLHTKKTWQDVQPYEGYFHPFDGFIAQYSLTEPVGYALWYFGKMPSWLPMIAISMFSRTFMGRRMQPQQRAGGAAPAPAAGAK